MASFDHVLEGMMLIYQYKKDEDDDFAVGYKQIWCCEYNPKKMTEADRQRMEEIGWFEDDGSWSKFI